MTKEQKIAQILELARWQVDREVLLTLVALAGLTVTTEQSRYLCGPLITPQNNMWVDMIPRWMTESLAFARLSLILSESSGQTAPLASSLEVAIVLMCQGMQTPMDSEWTNVYTWAGRQAYEMCHPSAVAQDWQGIAPVSLSRDEQEHHYRRLAADIRGKVVKHAPQIKALLPFLQAAADQKFQSVVAELHPARGFTPTILPPKVGAINRFNPQ